MFWTEVLFAWLPVDRRKRWAQILVRFLFLFLVWFSGFLVFSVDGLGAGYLSNVQLLVPFFGTGSIILFGTYMIQSTLAGTVLSIRPLLKLDDSAFKKLFGRIELYSFSFLPVLLLALLFSAFLPGSRLTLTQLTGVFQSAHVAWIVVIMFFLNLLTATGIWMGVAIWLTVFLLSRQPLEVELSARSVEKFRGLTNLASGFAVFYFLAIVIGVVIPLSSAPAVSVFDVVASPVLLYILIGVLGVLLPFYNIHRTLVALKRQELLRIDEEFDEVEKELNEVSGQPTGELSGRSVALMNHLFSLQIKERRVKAAKEWPIDVRFVSRLLGLVAAAAMARVLAEIINRLSA
jgi:hypothetical protein